MYYVLVISDSEAWSHSHEEYKMASKNKTMLTKLIKEIDCFKSSLVCSIEEIKTNNYHFVESSSWDWDFSYSEHEGLGLEYGELEFIERKKTKKYDDTCSNVSISKMELTENLTRKERCQFLESLGFSDVECYLEGYKNKVKSMKNGKYYYNPKKYDYYKGIQIL